MQRCAIGMCLFLVFNLFAAPPTVQAQAVFDLGTWQGFEPYDVALSNRKKAKRTAYVTDQNLNRVWQFNNITQTGQSGFSTVVWAYSFSGEVQGIATDKFDRVYVVTQNNVGTKVHMFANSGVWLMAATLPKFAGQGIDIGPTGSVYVTDSFSNAVHVLSAGNFQADNYGSEISPTTEDMISFPGGGSVLDVAVDSFGNVHCAFEQALQYRIYNSLGQFTMYNMPFSVGGVDANTPFPNFYTGVYRSTVSFSDDDNGTSMQFSWQAPVAGGPPDIADYTLDGGENKGCESTYFGADQYIFICSPELNTVRVYLAD